MAAPDAPLPARGLRWPAASLRAYLVLVMFVATVPLALFAFYLLQQQATAARAQVEAVIERTASSFALLVERELTSATDLLSGLAYNDALQRGDVAAFHQLVERAPPLRPGWRGVYLAEPDGTVVFASDQPFGRQLGRLRDGAALERIRATLQPTVTDLVTATASEELITGVQVPVMVRGNLRYVLGARIAASHWQQLSERSSVAEGGFVSLVDSQSRLIAHNLLGANELGRVLPPEREATGSTLLPWRALVGAVHGSLTVNRPVPSTGWTVTTGVPAAPLAANEARTLAKLVAAGALSVLLGLALALTVAQRVSTPLGQLARGGAAAVEGPVVVREIRVLREALRGAARQGEAARAALQRQADEFEALFRSSPIGLAMTLDAEGTRALINPALAALLGVEPGVHALAPLLDAQHAPALHLLRDGRPLALAEQPLQRAGSAGVPVQDDTLELLHSGGRRIQLEVQAVPLRDAAGAPRGAVAAFVDATERREFERQREQLVRSEREARRAAEAANRGKDEFFAMLGHELRNPLGAIGAAVEVLNRSQGQGEVAASARRVIERQTRHMAQLMNDLQDVARVGAGKLQLERRRLDLAQHVWRPLDALRLAGRLRNHAITLDLQRTIVDADPVRIEQVLVNLLTNAVKYTPAGGHVELTVGPGDEAALIELRDSGVGIAPELLSHVFDIFVQSERTADRRQGGMGLGLTLVRRLVELHGGSVAAASEGLDRGSTFTLRLPLADGEAGAARPRAPRWHGVVLGLETARPYEIEALLCGAGCRVTSSSDIAAGLDVISARRPDFVLVDAASGLAERVRATGVDTFVVGLGDGTAPGCDLMLALPLDLQVLQQHVAARSGGVRAA